LKIDRQKEDELRGKAETRKVCKPKTGSDFGRRLAGRAGAGIYSLLESRGMKTRIASSGTIRGGGPNEIVDQ